MHYNEILTQPFKQSGFDVIYQPSCLQRPYTGTSWTIQYPDVEWTDNTVVVMHCQDFINVDNNTSVDLENIENYFGENAKRVIVVVWNLHVPYNGPLNLIYFPTHSYELLTELQKTQDEWKPNLLNNRQYYWQCLNGTIKPHRVNVAHYLQKTFFDGILSLHDEIPLSHMEYSTHYSWNNVENWQLLLPVYSNCQANIVTETMYSTQTNIVTEKTLMALLAKQIPIVIGHKGIVRECESLGFDMFRDLVNLNYDNDDDEKRWLNAIRLNAHILEGKYTYDQYQDRLLANQTYVLNEWPRLLVKEFNNNAQDIVECLHR